MFLVSLSFSSIVYPDIPHIPRHVLDWRQCEYDFTQVCGIGLRWAGMMTSDHNHTGLILVRWRYEVGPKKGCHRSHFRFLRLFAPEAMSGREEPEGATTVSRWPNPLKSGNIILGNDEQARSAMCDFSYEIHIYISIQT